ncbi:hypothetical protein [Pontibacter sp. BAB1700]|uniref:hypothetical protein n=1 Tax=Pontibacter sp. BAB1700 TaxID=1144253 RepID=UPI00026BE165|nr:hypothetical protein [Pontibacter sp. BAB1700]EJF08367.1 TPR domain-containing protein [Pontibacter sp. BAB1700]
MKENLHTTFNKAVAYLKEGKVKEFGRALIELHEGLTCYCFFYNQDDEVLKNLIIDIEKIEMKYKDYNDEESEDEDYEAFFYYYLGKGFIYYLNDQEEIAYQYLSSAIAYNFFIDLPYSIRATIDNKINIKSRRDAQRAVLLNPSARNYYVLALENIKNNKKRLVESAVYLRKSLELNSYSSCAHRKLGAVYQLLKDYENAIIEYRLSMALEPRKSIYCDLSECLNITGRYTEALETAALGYKLYPSMFECLEQMGLAYYYLNSYEDAIHFYKMYQLEDSNNDNVNWMLEHVEKTLLDKVIMEAEATINDSDYAVAVEKIEQYMVKYSINYEIVKLYYVAKLKAVDTNIDISESNSLYVRLEKLVESCRIKDIKNEDVTEEEENAVMLREYKAGDIMSFGKYNGDTVSVVIDKEPEYILFSIINFENFALSLDLLLHPNILDKPEYILALEHNFIKNLLIRKWHDAYVEENRLDYLFNSGYSDQEHFGNNYDRPQSKSEWLKSEYGEDAETAYWNMD